MDLLISLFKVISVIATGVFAAIGLLTQYKNDSGKITKWGKIALLGIILTSAFSLILFALETFQAKAAADKSKAEANATARLLQDILKNAQITADQQKKNLEETERLKSSSAKTLEKQELNLQRSGEIAEGLEKSIVTQLSVLKSNRILQEVQGRSIQQLNRLSLDRNLSGVEFSFTPSAEHWSNILEAYKKINPLVPEVPYSAAPMIATRSGDHWKINFAPVELKAGIIRLPAISTDQPKYRAFEEVIRRSLLALWINWENGLETDLEPLRNEFPTTISVSKETIAISLRPPDLMLNLNNLNGSRVITLRVRTNYPNSLRIRSLDPSVMFDQIINLNWKETKGSSYLDRVKGFVSGPHRLRITFSVLSQ